MSLSFPILSRLPKSFSTTPINKSLTSDEKIGKLYVAGRELYPESSYDHNVSYENINESDYALLMNFFNVVDILFPFYYAHYNKIYSVTFSSPVKVSKSIYNYYNISFSLRTYFASTEKQNEYNDNHVVQIFNSTDNPYSSFSSYGNNVIVQSTNPYSVVISDDIDIITNNLYLLKTKLYMISGQNPFLYISSVTFPVIALKPFIIPNGYYEKFFIAKDTYNYDSYVLIYNTSNSSWLLTIEITGN